MEVERQAAKEYREKFYPMSGVYKGSGAGSIGSDSYGGGQGYSGAKTFTPYSSSSSNQVQSYGGSTYNITNNNNINYNYGSNITAISSDGQVPTFQELEKQKQA